MLPRQNSTVDVLALNQDESPLLFVFELFSTQEDFVMLAEGACCLWGNFLQKTSHFPPRS